MRRLLPERSLAFVTGLGAMWLTGCASNQAQTHELDDMRSEIQALKAQQAEQQREITRLRAQLETNPAPRVAERAPARAERAPAPAPAAEPRQTGPVVPENLKVVFVAPDPVVYEDAPRGQLRKHTTPASTPGGPPAALATETQIKEPTAPDATLAGVAVPAAAAEDPEFLDVEYKVALTAPNAVERLEAFAKAHPRHASADNALFEAGIRAERNGDGERAAHDFERAVAEHPAGDVVPDALLHLAACNLQLKRTAAAREALKQLSRQFPDSAQAEAARARLADLER